MILRAYSLMQLIKKAVLRIITVQRMEQELLSDFESILFLDAAHWENHDVLRIIALQRMEQKLFSYFEYIFFDGAHEENHDVLSK